MADIMEKVEKDTKVIQEHPPATLSGGAPLQRGAFDAFLKAFKHSQPELAQLLLLDHNQDLKLDQQWVFYNGSLIQAPSLSPTPLRSYNEQQTLQNFSLTIPNTNDSPTTIYLIHFYNPENNEQNNFSSSINLQLEENANVTLLECTVSLDNIPNAIQNSSPIQTSNAIEASKAIHANTHIYLEKAAKLNHYKLTYADSSSSSSNSINRSNTQTSNIKIHQEVKQESQSEYHVFVSNWGTSIYSAKLLLELMGTKAITNCNILLCPKKTESANIELIVHHQTENCESNLLARSVLQDKANFEFKGKIIINDSAKGSKARLENKNLLLSKEAQVNTEPQLEIYNGDVQCSHGATVGELDENALFYLQSRGIAKIDAIKMLVQAFFKPVLHNITHTPFQTFLEQQLHEQQNA